ncbi:MAG: hypothetical protein GXX85_13180 [Ignavibacteria bacterium]|nr:hypothetical protein [Ignavibacteria bacterium]
MKKRTILILLLIIFLIPQTILANAGTALMWMPILQLMFGNLLIGLIEGFAVSLIYKTKWYRSILIMIGGNYVSWLIGNGLILLFQEFIIDVAFQLKGVFVSWIISIVILYFLTVIIEFPFFNWIFKEENRSRKRSWRLSLILNVITYTAMILIYLSVSKYNFFTDLKINQSLLDKDYKLELYLKEGGNIYKGKISSDFKRKLVYKIPEKYKNLYPSLIENPKDSTIDLFLVNYSNDTLLLERSFIETKDKVFYPIIYEKYGWVKSDFRDTTNRDWEASAGGWAIEGLTINDENELKENYAFEVPWMFWGIGQVSIINQNELICVIYGRLVIMNKDTKEIAYITKADNYMIRKIE